MKRQTKTFLYRLLFPLSIFLLLGLPLIINISRTNSVINDVHTLSSQLAWDACEKNDLVNMYQTIISQQQQNFNWIIGGIGAFATILIGSIVIFNFGAARKALEENVNDIIGDSVDEVEIRFMSKVDNISSLLKKDLENTKEIFKEDIRKTKMDLVKSQSDLSLLSSSVVASMQASQMIDKGEYGGSLFYLVLSMSCSVSLGYVNKAHDEILVILRVINGNNIKSSSILVKNIETIINRLDLAIKHKELEKGAKEIKTKILALI